MTAKNTICTLEVEFPVESASSPLVDEIVELIESRGYAIRARSRRVDEEIGRDDEFFDARVRMEIAFDEDATSGRS